MHHEFDHSRGFLELFQEGYVVLRGSVQGTNAIDVQGTNAIDVQGTNVIDVQGRNAIYLG